MAEMNQKQNMNQLLSNEYFKNSKYIVFGMLIILIGIINFVIGFMYFPSIWVKNLSISTILVILGLCMIIVYENRIKRINKKILK